MKWLRELREVFKRPGPHLDTPSLGSANMSTNSPLAPSSIPTGTIKSDILHHPPSNPHPELPSQLTQTPSSSAVWTDQIERRSVPFATPAPPRQTLSEPQYSSKATAAPLRILCFDGGGFRGLASLIILHSIMNKISHEVGREVRPCEYFDLICGTSTGGLIAIMLGRLGWTVTEAITKYKEFGVKVFDQVGDVKKWALTGYPRVPESRFEEIAKEIGRVGTKMDQTMLNLDPGHCKCFVTTTIPNAPGSLPQLIRSYSSSELQIPVGHDWLIWEAARATSAAPVYFAPFSMHCGSSTYRFSDAGAAGYNNPSMLALDEVRKIPEFRSRTISCFLTLGTGLDTLVKNSPKYTNASDSIISKSLEIFNAPARVQTILDYFVTVATNSNATHQQVYNRLKESSVGTNVLFRFNPGRGLGDFDLADVTMAVDLETITFDFLRDVEISDQVERCAALCTP